MTPAFQTMITEGLKVVGEFLASGAIEEAKSLISKLRHGVSGAITPEEVIHDLTALSAKITADHAAEDKLLKDKYDLSDAKEEK